jgi:hypothetical protein
MHDASLHYPRTDKTALPEDPSISHGPLERARLAGPLSREEIAYCRSHRIGLAYDPVQIGWVVADCIDDIDVSAAADQVFKPRNLAPTYRFRAWTEGDVTTYRALLDDPAVWAMMYEA